MEQLGAFDQGGSKGPIDRGWRSSNTSISIDVVGDDSSGGDDNSGQVGRLSRLPHRFFLRTFLRVLLLTHLIVWGFCCRRHTRYTKRMQYIPMPTSSAVVVPKLGIKLTVKLAELLFSSY